MINYNNNRIESFNYTCIILEKHRHGGNKNMFEVYKTNGDFEYRAGLIYTI